ncbi:hypothetical protein PTKIN_Ptkin02bG0024400 [Pterospermum kingtungense]
MFPSEMGEASENRGSKEMSNLSLQIEKYPRDLLQRFKPSEIQASTTSEGEEEVELNLGLSLGGRFGVDKSAKKLTRSSSIAGSLPVFREGDVNTPPPVPYPSLMRASSLPTETEEEWRKRKELQTLRRMAAKRRRSEKQRSSREKMEEEKQQQAGRASNIGVGSPFGSQSWGAAARQVILGGRNEVMQVKGEGGGGGAAAFSQGSIQPCPQGSMESQGGSSSSMSPLQGASSCGEARSSGSTQSFQEEAMGSSGTKASETCRTPRPDVETLCKTVESKGKERGNAMEDMPCVFTKGEGPNGKRIEGILYKYGKGEEVRIMCVCHGNFLSPAEFVKHAGFVPFVVVLLMIGDCVGRPVHPSEVADIHVKPLQTVRPYNIAHRGSFGEFPEETVAAYKRAIEEGADFIETDILASKDGVLICFHDVILDNTTDVADHKQFANRKRSYQVRGVNITGWFVVDFTLEELKLLRVKQRFEFRDQQYNGKFSLITFQEFISLALDANRVIGIYPEIKNPVFINQHVKWSNGKRFEDKFVETLKKNGYKGSYMSKEWLRQPVFIQSFAPTSLTYISNLTDLPKVLVIADPPTRTEDTNQTFFEITSDSYFDFIKNYVVGIGPSKEAIVPSIDNHLTQATDLVAKAHAHGLQVHTYLFRNENMFLPFNFNQDPYEEYDYWINKVKVDGLFTDFAGSLHNFQEWTSNRRESGASEILHKIAKLISSYKDNEQLH